MRTVYELPTGRLIYTDTDNSAVYDLSTLPRGSGMRVLVCGPRRTTPLLRNTRGRVLDRSVFEWRVSRAPAAHVIVATYNPSFRRVMLSEGAMGAAARALFGLPVRSVPVRRTSANVVPFRERAPD